MIFLIAFSLRFYHCTYPSFKFMDEAYHAAAAEQYWNKGQFEPDLWEHPPLRHTLLYGFMRVFGDTPYGWRLRNILFGSVAAVLTSLFAYKATGSRKTSILAGLLLATDPLHVVLSHFTYEEIYGGAFFLAAIVLYQWHKHRSSWLMLSAFFVGCAMATKWYYLPGWLLMCILALREQSNYRKPKTALFIITTYLCIPLTIYVMSYYLWFGRGYTSTELLEFVINAYYSLQQLASDKYLPDLFFLSHLSASEWFTRLIVVGQGTYLDNGKGEFVLYTNNLPVWILTLPALLGTIILSIKRGCLNIALPAMLFCGSYALFILVRRPAFVYSSVPMLPFAFTMIAYCVTQIAERYSVRIYFATVTIMLSWNLYLYPLVTAKKIPVAFYQYILNNKDIQIRH